MLRAQNEAELMMLAYNLHIAMQLTIENITALYRTPLYKHELKRDMNNLSKALEAKTAPLYKNMGPEYEKNFNGLANMNEAYLKNIMQCQTKGELLVFHAFLEAYLNGEIELKDELIKKYSEESIEQKVKHDQS